MSSYFAIFLAVAVGAITTVQAALNTELGKYIGGVSAALVSFIVGTATLLIFYFFSGDSGFKGAARAPFYLWIGGVLGASFVYSMIKIIPIAGTGSVMAGVIAGQLLLALIIDQFGWLGMPRVPIDWSRGLGVVLLLAGVKLINR